MMTPEARTSKRVRVFVCIRFDYPDCWQWKCQLCRGISNTLWPTVNENALPLAVSDAKRHVQYHRWQMATMQADLETRRP